MNKKLMYRILAQILYFLTDNCEAIHLLLRGYRLLVYTKLTFAQFPLFSPYEWPLSWIHRITRPYIQFWKKIVPTLRFGKYPYVIGPMLGLEFLTGVLSYLQRIRILMLLQADIFYKYGTKP